MITHMVTGRHCSSRYHENILFVKDHAFSCPFTFIKKANAFQRNLIIDVEMSLVLNVHVATLAAKQVVEDCLPLLESESCHEAGE